MTVQAAKLAGKRKRVFEDGDLTLWMEYDPSDPRVPKARLTLERRKKGTGSVWQPVWSGSIWAHDHLAEADGEVLRRDATRTKREHKRHGR